MTIYEDGNPDADTVLIQLTGDHELSVLENEVWEIRKRTSIDFRFLAAKLMTGTMSCPHGKHRRCLEMKILEMVLPGHWSRFCHYAQIKARHIISADIPFQVYFQYGQHIKQIYSLALQLLHRLSGFQDLLTI